MVRKDFESRAKEKRDVVDFINIGLSIYARRIVNLIVKPLIHCLKNVNGWND